MEGKTTRITPPQTSEVEGHACKVGATPETDWDAEVAGHGQKIQAQKIQATEEPETEGLRFKFFATGESKPTDDADVEGHAAKHNSAKPEPDPEPEAEGHAVRVNA